MPGPSREQFEAAARHVMQTAPPGLSRDQFFTQIDQELKNQNLKEANAKPLHEPSSYWGGVWKSVDDQAREMANSSAQSMAHPQTPGDFLSLLIPETGMRMVPRTSGELGLAQVAAKNPAVGAAGRGAARVGSVAAGAVDSVTPKALRMPIFKKTADYLGKVADRKPPQMANFDLTPELDSLTEPSEVSPSWLDRYKPNTSGTPDRGVESHLPGHEFQADRYMPNESGYETGGEASGGSERPPASSSPGVPSEEPPPSDTRYNELLDKFGGKGPGGAEPLENPSAISKPEPLANASGEPVSLEDYMQHLLVEHDPGAMAGRAQDLRAQVGSRDAARSMFGTANSTTQDWLKKMAPGPSRVPLSAQERIAEAIRKAALEGEDK